MNTRFDTFTGAGGSNLSAHTGDDGLTYSVHPAAAGAINLSATGIYGAATAVYLVDQVLPYSSVSGDFLAVTTPSSGSFSLLLSLLPLDLTCYVARYSRTSGLWELGKYFDGTFTSFANVSATITPGTVYRVEFSDLDGVLTLLVDGWRILFYDDSAAPLLASGQAGFRWAGTMTETTGYHFDNLTISQLRDIPVPVLTATPGDEEVVLSYETDPAVSSHVLYWATSPGVETTDNDETGITDPWTHTGRTNGTAYYYRLAALTEWGETDLSNEVSSTPQAPVGSLQTDLIT